MYAYFSVQTPFPQSKMHKYYQLWPLVMILHITMDRHGIGNITTLCCLDLAIHVQEIPTEFYTCLILAKTAKKYSAVANTQQKILQSKYVVWELYHK